MIKAKDFDAKRVTLGPNVPVGVGNYSQRVLYDGAPLRVQLPPMVVSKCMYQIRGKFCINVLLPEESVTSQFVNSVNTAIQGVSPICRTTQDHTGAYYAHLRLRVSLPPLIAGTDGLHHAKVGHSIRAIATVAFVGRHGDWDLHLERIAESGKL